MKTLSYKLPTDQHTLRFFTNWNTNAIEYGGYYQRDFGLSLPPTYNGTTKILTFHFADDECLAVEQDVRTCFKRIPGMEIVD